MTKDLDKVRLDDNMNGKLMLDFEVRDMRRNRILKEVGVWAGCILATVLFAFIIMFFCFEKTAILDTSMEGALNKDDHVIINKISYLFSSPKRYDVIVYEKSTRSHSYYGVKRVIGLPGEKVLIKEGFVYIDGKKLEEKYIVDEIEFEGLAEDEIELGEGEYFVLGDNRNNSEDSRFANVANITKKEIVGKALVKLDPLQFVSELNKVHDSEKEDEKEL